MSWFLEALGDVPDPRAPDARHDLLEILTMALVASICGAEDCSDFEDFAIDREALFGEVLTLKHGVPSHDTFSRVFRRLDPRAFSAAFARFLDDLGAGGASEIVAARAVPECLDLSGQLVTADALHCQGETARIVLERGGDYLVRLKSNRPALHEMVAGSFAAPDVAADLPGAETTDLPGAETTDAHHGHVEVRKAAPKLAEWLEANVPEGLAVFTLPKPHRRRMRTSNPIERAVQQEIKRRTKKVRVFPNEASLLRLVTAVLAEIDEDWATTDRVYINMENRDD
ncbi:transposase family protein [Roseospira visakhapatnamensis]|uniref:H repeat-associated protein N-terminal domain-containing protein n=1 Tax=Roseospira visakhapatnamensis TaxID=390880 RepID=A0A7W6RG18_9PROT|nr:hypothetical protein [Roseospira visakhapatnamensis]